MESLSRVFCSSPPLHIHIKIHKPLTPKPTSLLPKSPPSSVTLNSHIAHFNSYMNSHLSCTKSNSESELRPILETLAETVLITTISASTAFYSLPCFASESLASSSEQDSSDKINIEAIVVSIDNFFRRYPFFVAGCTFIWLIVLPIAKYYLSKCKYIYSIDAFKKLQEDPNAQLLDIRDAKSVKSLKSPNLKLFNKSTVQVPYSEVDTDGFLKNVLANFSDPGNTVVCILDDLDGNSMKVAELLFKNGFKEAYALKGGVAGKKGWLEIQEKLLPPSIHILSKRKTKKSKELGEKNGVDNAAAIEETQGKISASSSSPYPNYPELKPPTSPTPSKPSTK